MNIKFIDAFKRDYPHVSLIMASKYLSEVSAFKAYIEAGILDFGENRVEALLDNKEALAGEAIRWHFIGTLQTKKVKKVINAIDVLHTLDRLKLADEIEKRRETPLDCFIQVNISRETQKHGVMPEAVDAFVHALKGYTKIRVIGFMGMAEDTKDEAVLKAQFSELQALTKHYEKYTQLSMGMSQDFRVALSVGATHVRLGRILLSEAGYEG